MPKPVSWPWRCLAHEGSAAATLAPKHRSLRGSPSARHRSPHAQGGNGPTTQQHRLPSGSDRRPYRWQEIGSRRSADPTHQVAWRGVSKHPRDCPGPLGAVHAVRLDNDLVALADSHLDSPSRPSVSPRILRPRAGARLARADSPTRLGSWHRLRFSVVECWAGAAGVYARPRRLLRW
jgi:hypothetical protein